jgi:hypothetical protein
MGDSVIDDWEVSVTNPRSGGENGRMRIGRDERRHLVDHA